MIVPEPTVIKRGNSPGTEAEVPNRVWYCDRIDAQPRRAKNRNGRVGMSLQPKILVIVICLVSCACTAAHAQVETILAPDAQNTISTQDDPEHAYLSATRYTNVYFGFEIDLPAEARLAPIPLPAARDRRIQLLALIGPAPQYAAISLFAYEYKGKNWTDAKGILRHELDQDLYTGVEELHGLSKSTIGGHQFYYFETRKGIAQHEEFATDLSGYVLQVVLEANDAQMVKQLTTAFSRLIFFPPQEAQEHAGSGALAYEGPAVSSQRLRELRATPPAERMDPGRIDGNLYFNQEIGMRFELPKGWSIQPQGAVEPAVLRYREKVSGEPLMGPRERDVVKACRKTLFSAWKTKPGADGQVPYDDFGEVTLSTMPLACFPNMRFPDSPHDADAVRRFLVGFSYSHPLQRDMTDARTFEASGKTFVVTHGTIAYKEAGDELSRRISVATVLTQHRGYLLVWLFAAPHDAELRELMNAKMGFDPEPKTTDAKVSISPSSEKAQVAGGSVPAESAAGGSGLPASASASSMAKSQSRENTIPATDPATYRPSLLKPGETMQDGQNQGKPLPKSSSQ